MAVPVLESGWVSSDSGGSTASSLTLTAPTGIAADDLLLIIVGSDDATDAAQFSINTGTYPGWIKVGESPIDPVIARGAHGAVFYKIAGGSEGDVVVDHVSNDELLGWYLRVSGVDTVAPINGSLFESNTGTSIAWTAGDITTDVDDCLLFYLVASDGGDCAPYAITVGGADWTEIDENTSGTSGQDCAGCFGTSEVATAGDNVALTISQSENEGYAQIIFAIAPEDIDRSGSIDQTLPGLTSVLTGTFLKTYTASVDQTLSGLISAATGTHLIDKFYLRFDESDDVANAPNWGTGGSGAFSEFFGTQSTISDPNVDEMWAGGTSANGFDDPGETIGLVRFRTRVNITAYDDLDIEVFTDGKAESLGSYNTGPSVSGFMPWTNLSAPSGGWTWAKLAALEIYFNPVWTSGDGQCQVFGIELEVSMVLPALETSTYYYDGNAIAAEGADWVNHANAEDGNAFTYAQQVNPDTGNLTIDGVNAPPLRRSLVTKVEGRFKGYNNAYDSINVDFDDRFHIGSPLLAQVETGLNPEAYSTWGELLESIPGTGHYEGGFYWEKISNLELSARGVNPTSGGQVAVFKAEIRVTHAIDNEKRGYIKQTFGGLSQTLSGTFLATQTFSGPIDQTLVGLSSVLTGTFEKTYSASITQTLGGLVSVATGTFEKIYTASIDQELPKIISIATGNFVPWSATGTIDQLLPQLMSSATGTHSPPVFAGPIDQTLPGLTQALTGTFAITYYASIDQTFGQLSVVTANQDANISISDTNAAWSDDANAFDGSTSTFASNVDPIAGRQLAGWGNDIVHEAGSVVQVEGRFYVSSVDGSSLGAIAFGLDGEALLHSELFTNSTLGWTNWGLLDVPVVSPGWDKTKVDELFISVWRATGTGELRAYAAEIRVTYRTGPLNSVVTGTFFKTYSASIDQTLAGLTSVLTGTFLKTYSASIDQILPGLTSVVTGTFEKIYSASIDQTLLGLLSVATGTATEPSFDATINQTFIGLTSVATGTFLKTYTASVDQTLPGLLSVVTGTVVNPVYSGPIDQTFGGLISVATGTATGITFDVTIDQTFIGLSQSLSGTFLKTYTASINQILPGLTSVATGTFFKQYTASIDQTLVGLTSILTGTATPPGWFATIDQTLGGLVQTLTGTSIPPVFSASIDQTLPSLLQTLTGTFLKTYTGSITQTLPGLIQVMWYEKPEAFFESFIWIVPDENFFWMVEDEVFIYEVPTDDLIYIITTGE